MSGPALRSPIGWLYLECVSPHQRKIAFIVERLLEWYPKNARDLPWRRTNDPYCVFVSEIMLQQTQVKTVVPYWERWMRELPTVASLARAKPERIHKLWEGLGYYTRVRNMQKAAQIIVGEHGGAFPSRFEEVLRLPGIGRYTAGAICSIAFGQPTPILDGNVLRVLTRLFGIGGNPRDKQVNRELWRLAEELVRAAGQVVIGKGKAGSRSPCSLLNQGLMELGALVCTPRQPQCGVCPVAGCCTAWKEGRVERLPEIPHHWFRHPFRHRFLRLHRGSFFFIVKPDGTMGWVDPPTTEGGSNPWFHPCDPTPTVPV
jgi:A/G-specific adenine glycosylase